MAFGVSPRILSLIIVFSVRNTLSPFRVLWHRTVNDYEFFLSTTSYAAVSRFFNVGLPTQLPWGQRRWSGSFNHSDLTRNVHWSRCGRWSGTPTGNRTHVARTASERPTTGLYRQNVKISHFHFRTFLKKIAHFINDYNKSYSGKEYS